MLKKIWNDPVGSKIIAATILGVCSLIGGVWLHSRNQTRTSEPQISQPVKTPPVENTTLRIGESQTVAQHKTFIDRQTGFSFYINEITGTSWGPLRTDGVLGNYILPDGKHGEFYRHQAGYRFPFNVGERKFVFVIVDIDYKAQTATFRVDELVPVAGQSASPDH